MGKQYINIYRKSLYTLLFCSLISCASHISEDNSIQYMNIPTVTYNEIQKRKNGLLYKRGSRTPYTGFVISIYPSGEIRSKGSVQNGKMTGEYTEYFEGGQVKIKGEYRNGVQEGTWITNHNTGAVALKGQFINGLLQGTWYVYSQDGMLAKKMIYHNGILTKTIRYRSYKGKPPERI